MILWLFSCLAPVLEAPFVLAPGVDATALSLDAEGSLLAAVGPAGAVRIDGEGQVTPLWSEPTLGVVGLPGGRFYAWDDTQVQRRDPSGAITDTLAVDGAHDVVGWCADAALVATDAGVLRWEGEASELWWSEPVAGLLFETCEQAIAWQGDQVLTLPGAEVLVEAPGTVLAVARRKRDGGLFVLHEPGPVLSHLHEGELTVVARYPGAARDAVFGFTGLVSPDNVYLANPGSLDYLRPR